MSKAVVWARTRGGVALGRPRRSLAPLAVVTVAAMLFAVLLILVRLRWPPLESADHGAAARINHLIAGDRTAPDGGASHRPRHRQQLPQRALTRLDRLLRL